MKLLLRLIFRDAWLHRARISLAVLATIAMSCMIVWLIGSLDLMMLRFDEEAENYFGHYQVAMVPGRETGGPGGPGGPQPRSARPARPAPGAASAGPGAPAGSRTFPASVIKELQADDIVVTVTPVRQVRNIMGKMEHENDFDAAVRRQRSVTGIPAQSPTLFGIATNESPFELKEGRWFDERADPVEGVMGTGAAASLGGWGGDDVAPATVGDSVICRIGTKDFRVKIVGLVEQKLVGGGRGADPAVSALYVPIDAARRMSRESAAAPGAGMTPGPGGPESAPAPEDEADRIDFVFVRLREGANTRQFEERWGKHLEDQSIAMQFLDVDKVQDRLNRTRARGSGGLMGGAGSRNSIILFSAFVSILIVFTALSMGVSERTRVFAMLRTVGMPRRKIAFLVFGESVILCFLGWIGGMAAGWLVLQISVWAQPAVFGTGKTVSLNMTAVLTAGLAALVGSLLASIFPAWRATRISPLEGMNRGYVQSINRNWFFLCALIGAALLVVNPLIVYQEGIAKGAELRLFLYTYVGLPTQLAGCLLLAPAMILIVEKLFAPLVAKLVRIPKNLLASQLSSNIWRTLGTTLALCVGLGVYSFLQICGYSMLEPYIQSKTLPDTLVTFLPSGVPFSEIETVRNLPGVDAQRFLPIALDQSHFSQRQTDRFRTNGLISMQTSAVVFGIDIDEAFGKHADGSRPLIEVPFQEGDLPSAMEKLRTGGRYCLVPDSFAFRAGLHVGDKLELVLPGTDNGAQRGGRGGRGGRPGMQGGGAPGGEMQGAGMQGGGAAGGGAAGGERPEGAGRPDFAGPGGEGGRGGRGGRPGGGPPGMGGETILEYEICGIVTINGWLWMNKISGVRKRGYRSGAMILAPYETVKNDYKLTDAAYFWFDRTLGADGKPTVSDKDLEQALQQLADKHVPQTEGVSRSMVKVSSREYLLDRVGNRADQVIQAAAKMPLILLAISSFGMMGTIAASVRTRRFELGVLRSLGVTRFGLVRLILAEALLISLAVIVISFGFGVIGGWCFIGLMKYVSGFGAFTNPLTIPVYWISVGFAVALIFCFLAALGPAIGAGRTETSRLLQER